MSSPLIIAPTTDFIRDHLGSIYHASVKVHVRRERGEVGMRFWMLLEAMAVAGLGGNAVAQPASAPQSLFGVLIREMQPAIQLSWHFRVIRLATQCGLRSEAWANAAAAKVDQEMTAKLAQFANSLPGFQMIPAATMGTASMQANAEFRRYGEVACKDLQNPGGLRETEEFLASVKPR